MAVVGRVLLIPRGSWTSTDVYNRLDWVRYNGVAWVCKQDNTTGIVPSTSAPEWQILAQDGTVGGWSSIASKPFSTIGSGLMVNASDELMVAKNLVTDKTTVQALNELLTGTGTAGYDAGSGASPRYFPAKYIYNTMLTVADGDMVTIKIPVAGSEYGVYVSLDNGSTYHPVALRETTKFSTEYGVGAYITLIYDTLGSVSDIYPVAGGDTPGTVTGGAFKLLNYSDNNVTQTASNGNNEYEVLFSGSADNVTRAEGARKSDNLTFNPSTGNLNVTTLNGSPTIQWIDATVPSGVLSYTISNAAFNSNTRVVQLLTEGGYPYSSISVGNGTCTISFSTGPTGSLPISVGIVNV